MKHKIKDILGNLFFYEELNELEDLREFRDHVNEESDELVKTSHNLSFPVTGNRAERYPYLNGPAKFGHRRSGGDRLHAGVDIYFKPFVPETECSVYAIEDGIVENINLFYKHTYAIQISSKLGTFRYCELIPSTGLEVGDKVAVGTCIGHASKVIDSLPTMLHLEMYSGNESGPLTNRNLNPYSRRSDLLDPTSLILYLEKRERSYEK